MATSTSIVTATDLRATNDSACNLCRGITISKLSTGFFHHESTDQLQESAKTCSLCLILFSCLKKDPEPSPEENDLDERIWIQAIKSAHGQTFRANVFTHDAEGRIRVAAERGSAAASRIYGRPIRTHARCIENFNLAREWLTDCAVNHPECSMPIEAPSTQSILPARVIDIGVETKIRLLQTNGQQGSWIALSYCWGEDGAAFLTKQNETFLTNEIPWYILPQTFHDAIYIARELGIRYLWIDTLCILQDCPEDWYTQCTYMPFIYSGATLVLAADASPTSRGGILTCRPAYPTCVLDMGTDGHVSFAPLFDKDTPEYLGKRGWCFQEEYLGHRRLTYYQTHMEYTCTRHTLTEHEYPHDLSRPKSDVSSTSSAIRKAGRPDNFQAKILDESARKNSEAFYKYWYDAVSQYTLRDFTKSDDKLAAISGLASRIGHCTGEVYLAGLWLPTLPQSLLWRAVGQKPLQQPDYYRAPSWSWASADGYLDINMNDHEEFETSCEVLDVCAIPRGSDPYGQVQAGYIRLRGLLKEGFVGHTITRKVYQGYDIHIPLLDPTDVESMGDNSYCKFDTASVAQGGKVWCLEIRTDRPQGLLLEETGNNHSEYKRIGVFVLDDFSGMTPDWFEGCEKQAITIV